MISLITLYSSQTLFSSDANISIEKENNATNKTESVLQNPHRIYVGPDVFVAHDKIKFSTNGEKVDIRSNTVFGGLRVGYDFLKPKAFYFGTDGLLAMGRTFVTNDSMIWRGWYHYRIRQKIRSSPLWANIEQKFGYAFQSTVAAKSTLTPFIGLGWYYIKPQYDDDLSSSNWFYGSAGLKANQQFSDNFDVGFNLKAMYAFTGRKKAVIWSRQIKEDIKNQWGYEVGLPFTWHLGSSKKWAIQFQPYLIKIDINSTGQILGARLLAEYRF